MPQTVNINFEINKRKFAFKMTLDPSSLPDRDMMLCMEQFGCPEPEVIHLMTRVLRPGDFAIDGGANTGFFTIVMAQLVDTNGIVLAVEPGENNLPRLRDNLKINGLQNFEICNRPLWSSSEDVTLYYNQHGGMNSLSAHQPMMGKKILQGIQLSQWHTTPRLIKLDIEGAEEHALRGAQKHLVNHVLYIVCELNLPALKALGSTQESLRKFMREWGYSTFILFRDGQLPCLVPDKTQIFEAEDYNGTVNVLFSTVEAVSNVWPRAVLRYV
jgi:FkbM family methyltransferase